MVKIAWLVPTYNIIYPQIYRSHLLAAIHAQKRGYDISDLGMTEHELIWQARNRLAKGFLQLDCTHAFCCDSDIILPQHAVTELVNTDEPIVTGIYCQTEPPYHPNIYGKCDYSRKGEERGKHRFLKQWKENDIFKVDGAGFGCVLIRREVFEKVKAPWFEWTEESGEDLDFFLKVGDKNIPMFCNSKVLCGHAGGMKYITPEDYRKYAEKENSLNHIQNIKINQR